MKEKGIIDICARAQDFTRLLYVEINLLTVRSLSKKSSLSVHQKVRSNWETNINSSRKFLETRVNDGIETKKKGLMRRGAKKKDLRVRILLDNRSPPSIINADEELSRYVGGVSYVCAENTGENINNNAERGVNEEHSKTTKYWNKNILRVFLDDKEPKVDYKVLESNIINGSLRFLACLNWALRLSVGLRYLQVAAYRPSSAWLAVWTFQQSSFTTVLDSLLHYLWKSSLKYTLPDRYYQCPFAQFGYPSNTVLPQLWLACVFLALWILVISSE